MKDTKRNILIVDDDEDFAESLVDILAPRGYITRIAHSVEETFEITEKFAADVALLDIRLGRTSGISLIKKLKELHPKILCVMMTAYAAIDTAIEALQQDAYDYLRKPLNAQDLLATLDRCFDRINIEREKDVAQEALKRSEEKYRTLVEIMSDGLVVNDTDGILNYVNPRFCDLLGYSREEIIGMPVTELLDPTSRDIYIDETKNRKPEETYSYELIWTKKDRSKLTTIVSPRILKGDREEFQGSFSVITDISQRKLSEDFVRIQRDLGLALSKSIDLNEALRFVLDASIKVSNLDNGSIFLVDESTGDLDLVLYDGVNPDFARNQSHHDANSIYAKRVRSGKPTYISYAELGLPVDEVNRRESLKSYAIIPVIHQGNVIAALNVGSHYLNEIPLNVRSPLEAIAAQIGGVLARVNAESFLIRERLMLESIISLNPYAIGIFDANGYFVRGNREFHELFGGVLPRDISVFNLQIIKRENLFSELKRVRDGEAVKLKSLWFNPREINSDFPDKHLCLTITIFSIFSPHGEVDNVIFIFEDITDQVRAEIALKESEQKLRAIVQGAKDTIYIKDKDLKYTFVNSHMEKLFRVPCEEFIGKDAPGMFGTKTEGPEIERDDRKVLQGEIVERERTVNIDGEDFTLHVVKVPMRDEEGTICGLCAIARDITDRKKFEKQLLEYQKQLQSLTSQLSITEERERRRLATELHDRIGQTLAFTKIKIGLISEDADSGKISEKLSEVKELVDQVIKDTRTLTFELSPPVLYELGFEAAVEWLAEEFEKNHKIKIRIQKDGQDKPIDENLKGLLFQSVRELIINVIKHSQAKIINISMASEDGELIVSVEDDGIGFDPDIIMHKDNKNVGFGLFSIRERLNHFGGKMLIESESEKGTKIILKAPLTK